MLGSWASRRGIWSASSRGWMIIGLRELYKARAGSSPSIMWQWWCLFRSFYKITTPAQQTVWLNFMSKYSILLVYYYENTLLVKLCPACTQVGVIKLISKCLEDSICNSRALWKLLFWTQVYYSFRNWGSLARRNKKIFIILFEHWHNAHECFCIQIRFQKNLKYRNTYWFKDGKTHHCLMP